MTSPLLCITGPTAAGKTALAIAAAEALNGELISVDSALVYRGLDIGAAKPEFPHHLVDICDPTESYSAARFLADARTLIDEIRQRGRRPILVGGTLLYFRALIDGLSPLPPADARLRRRIEEEAAQHGWPWLHARLAELDPQSAARIHPRHSQRLARALEVCRLTGQPMSALQGAGRSGGIREPLLPIALAPRDRSVLHERIARRFAQMLDAGLVEEVRGLHRRADLHPGLPALRAVGYRQIWDHLDGRYSLQEAEQRALAATRQLAKRQFTWLRKWQGLRWILTDDRGRIIEQGLSPQSVAKGPILDDPAALLLNYLRTGSIV